MKITFVVPHSAFGGGPRVIGIYAKNLQKRGHEVLFVSSPEEQLGLHQQVKSLLKGKGWISRSNPSYFATLDVPYRVIDRFRPLTDDDVPDADIILATWWLTAEWVANLSEAKGAKVYFIQHHEIFDYLPKKAVEATYSLPLHKITVAQWLTDLMQTQYGNTEISFVPNSVDTKLFYAPPRGKQSAPTVGILYSSAYWKGTDISLKAFSLAAQRIPNLRLVAFGNETLKPELPLPPDTEYTFKPPQNSLKDFYSSCDAWLFGSRSEGFGLPILEAMACRTPVIGTPAGAAPELLAGGAGILVKAEDPEDMANAIERICRLSEGEWQTISDTAYAKVLAYTWDDATNLFETALNTAIERKRR